MKKNVVINGKKIDLQEIADLTATRGKVEAIKHVKEITGLGLKEAKDIVDNLASSSKNTSKNISKGKLKNDGLSGYFGNLHTAWELIRLIALLYLLPSIFLTPFRHSLGTNLVNLISQGLGSLAVIAFLIYKSRGMSQLGTSIPRPPTSAKTITNPSINMKPDSVFVEEKEKPWGMYFIVIAMTLGATYLICSTFFKT